MNRELGAAASECPNCGAQLETEAQPDGSVAVSACPTCYPASSEGQKAPETSQEPAGSVQTAEQAGLSAGPMVNREHGTDIDEGVN